MRAQMWKTTSAASLVPSSVGRAIIAAVTTSLRHHSSVSHDAPQPPSSSSITREPSAPPQSSSPSHGDDDGVVSPSPAAAAALELLSHQDKVAMVAVSSSPAVAEALSSLQGSLAYYGSTQQKKDWKVAKADIRSSISSAPHRCQSFVPAALFTELDRFYTIYLPQLLLLVQPPSQQQQQGVAVAVQAVEEGLCALLSQLKEARQVTGRRFPSLLSPSVVGLLCTAFMNLSPPATRGPGRGRSATLLHRQCGRALSQQLTVLHDLLPPSSLILAMRSLQAARCLSDDVMSTVVKSLLEPSYWARHYRYSDGGERQSMSITSTSANPQTSSAFAAYGYITPVVAVKGLTGPLAAQWMMLLGKQTLPGHFHAHKLVHSVLLPPFQAWFVAAVASTTTAADGAVEGLEMLQDWASVRALLQCAVRYAIVDETFIRAISQWVASTFLPRLSLPGLLQLMRLLRPSAQAAEVPVARQRLAGFVKNKTHKRHSTHPLDEVKAGKIYSDLIVASCAVVALRLAESITSRSGLARGGVHSLDASLPLEASSPPPPQSQQLLLVSPAVERREDEIAVEAMLTLLRVRSGIHTATSSSSSNGSSLSSSPRCAEWDMAFTTAATALMPNLILPGKQQQHTEPGVKTAAVHMTKRQQQQHQQLCYRVLGAWMSPGAPCPSHPLFPALLQQLVMLTKDPDEDEETAHVSLLLCVYARMVKQQLYHQQQQEQWSGTSLPLYLFPEPVVLRLWERFLPLAMQVSGAAFVAALSLGAAASQPQHHGDHKLFLDSLPEREKVSLCTRLTQLSVSLPPSLLVEAIVSVTRRGTVPQLNASSLPLPAGAPEPVDQAQEQPEQQLLTLVGSGVDALQVHQWLSRFTIEQEALRHLSLAHCSQLIHILSLHPSLQADNAVVLELLVKRVGKTLSHLMWNDRPAVSTELEGADAENRRRRARLLRTVRQVPALMAAMKAAGVLRHHIMSRLTRVLLLAVSYGVPTAGEDEGGEGGINTSAGRSNSEVPLPLGYLLPCFHTMAVEWVALQEEKEGGAGTHRPPQQLFRDVWEQLRRRLVEGDESDRFQQQREALLALHQDAASALSASLADAEETAAAEQEAAEYQQRREEEAAILAQCAWDCVGVEVGAWNTFVLLDDEDTVLFDVLFYRLSSLIQRVGEAQDQHSHAAPSMVAQNVAASTNTTAAAEDGEPGEKSTEMDITVTTPPLLSFSTILHLFDTSALSLLVRVALLRLLRVHNEGGHSRAAAAVEEGRESGSDWMALAPYIPALYALLEPRRLRELYPQDVVSMMTVLLATFSSIASPAGEEGVDAHGGPKLSSDQQLSYQLLHYLYDAYRECFLTMFTPSSPHPQEEGEGDEGQGHSLQAAGDDGAGALQEEPREETEDSQQLQPAASLSLLPLSARVVPPSSLARLIIAHAGMHDPVVVNLCVRQVCIPGICSGAAGGGQSRPLRRSSGGSPTAVLPIEILVNLCLAVAFHYGLSQSPPSQQLEHEQRPVSCIAAVLDGIWHRTEELEERHIQALRRCLIHKAGDEDFWLRLQEQQELLQSAARKNSREEEGSVSSAAAAAAAASSSPQQEALESSATVTPSTDNATEAS